MTDIQNRTFHNKNRFQYLCIFSIRVLYMYKYYGQNVLVLEDYVDLYI